VQDRFRKLQHFRMLELIGACSLPDRMLGHMFVLPPCDLPLPP
jgi:hypothetical protein